MRISTPKTARFWGVGGYKDLCFYGETARKRRFMRKFFGGRKKFFQKPKSFFANRNPRQFF